MVVGVAKLVDEPLGSFSLLHDTLLVVLPEGPGQLVEVHGRTVFSLAPQVGHLCRIDDLKDALGLISPVYVTC